MNYRRQVSRALDDEHRANLDFIRRIEDALSRSAGAGCAQDPELPRLVGEFCRQLEQDLGRHFDFEERELFPRMRDSGDGDMAALLEEEHAAIRAVAREVLPLAQAASTGGLDEAGRAALKRGALEMVERQVAHIQKETMALLPLVDELLDEATDRELSFAYAAG